MNSRLFNSSMLSLQYEYESKLWRPKNSWIKCLMQLLKDKYAKVFNPIPHVDELPTDIYCCIKLKDASKTFTTRSYSSPQKYKVLGLPLSNNI
jgi:hypothetical protein